MLRRKANQESRKLTLMLGMAAALLVIFIVIFPEKAFQASLHGLNVWWKIVFPALLPFLVASEILLAFGVVHFLGVWLDPLMKLLFRVPGIGGWVVAMGITAGYPAGAKIISTLRAEEQVSRYEGERLLSLSHTSNPVFIISVVAVGFYHNAELGFMLAVIHFISAFIVGLLMRFHGSRQEPGKTRPSSDRSGLPRTQQEGLLRGSLSVMFQAHKQDGRSFGKLLGDSVTSSLQTLLVIGGYMMMFSVILQVISLSRLSSLFQEIVEIGLLPLGLPSEVIPHLLTGVFEVNLGTYAISEASDTPLLWQAALIGAALGWSGLSIHAQVRSLISTTDLSYIPFFISRLLHSALAFTFSFWLWTPLNRIFNHVEPSFLYLNKKILTASPVILPYWSSLSWFYYLAACLVVIMGGMVCISGFISLFSRRMHIH